MTIFGTSTFMVELERNVIPKLFYSIKMSIWKCYVNGTIAYVKVDAIEFVLSVLNSFRENIKFTYELENNGKIAFLDVLL